MYPSHKSTEKFDLEAWFWLPNAPGNKVSGSLYFSPERIVLSLEGSFDGDSCPTGERRTIFGQMFDGRLLSLMDCVTSVFETDQRSGGARSLLEVQLFLIGVHLISVDDTFTRSVKIEFDDNFEYSFSENNPFCESTKNDHEFELSWTSPSPAIFQIKTASCQLKLDFTCYKRVTAYQASIDHRSCLGLEFSDLKSVQQMLDSVRLLQNFLTILHSHAITIDKILLEIAVDSKLREVQVHIKQPVNEFASPVPGTFVYPFVRFCAMKSECIEQVLNNFFAQNSAQRETIKLLVDLINGPKLAPRTLFVSLSQALEAYDRAVSTTHVYLEKSQYAEIESKLLDAIPSELDPDFKERIRSSIKYAYQYSLRTRLRRLVQSLPEECRTILFDNSRKFVDCILEFRNSLTHGDLDELPTPGNRNLEAANASLRIFFVTLLLYRWGVPASLLIEGFKHSWDFKLGRLYRLW